MRLRRRGFLGLTAAGVLAPFVPTARSFSGVVPKRLVLLYTPNGVVPETFWPSAPPGELELSPTLAPLESLRHELNVVNGLRVSIKGPGDDHQRGVAHLWTGSKMSLLEEDSTAPNANGAKASWAQGPSIDQVVADAIGHETPFRSLELGVQSGTPLPASRMCYAGADQPLPPEDDPNALFDRVFGSFGHSPEDLARLRTERRSVIDAVSAELSDLRARHGRDDQAKLDAHLQALREVEKRLDAGLPGGAHCSQPPVAPELDPDANERFPAVSRSMIDMAAMALSCDLTRVISLQWSHGISRTRFSWLGHSRDHHDLSHEHAYNEPAMAQLSAIDAWYASEVAYLLAALAAIPEGDGSVLDHTLVVWGTDLARGSKHDHWPTPFVLAGRADGYFETGRLIDVGDVSHNRLLVSIGNAMGLEELDVFGNLDEGSGPLAGLR